MDIENTVLKLKLSDESICTVAEIIGFRCVKERYTPYSVLDVTAICSEHISDVLEVRFEIGGRVIHRGITDSMTVTESGGQLRLRLSSRGFSSMLSNNELEPGLLAGISLNKLMTEKMSVPNITWQDSAETVRYIYVKEHDSQWSAIVSLGLTLNEQYPYIYGANEICLYPRSDAVTVTPQDIYEIGETNDYSKVVSHFHMKDTGGEYTHSYTDGFAEARGIIRHKYINFDRQFIALDDFGLQYRLNFTRRGCRARFMGYLGWDGEELLDKIVFPDGEAAEISKVEICGNVKKGIFTKAYCYYDCYCNVSE